MKDIAKASYGVYGSLAFYAALAVTAFLSLILIVFTEYLQLLFMVILFTSATLLVSVPSVLSVIYGSRRIGLVPEIVAAGSIGANDRVLDVGTGSGFPAIEIAKAVRFCRVVGIDVWDRPARGQLHKGFLIGNSKEKAERNSLLEGVQDRVEFRQCDAREMPFESESFDVVVLEKLRELGFREIQLRNLGRFPFFLKVLSAAKANSSFSAEHF